MKRLVLAATLCAVFAWNALAQSAPTSAGNCEGLANVSLPQAKITSAQLVAAGAFAPPAAGTPQPQAAVSFFKSLPLFCRIAVDATPSADSDIRIEVWLPAAGWNGKFLGRGNGGFAGQIDVRSMALAISQGYATAATDTGHSGEPTDARWALGHPEKVIDFGYRAIHVMTQIAKSLVAAYYSSAPRRSYFSSCSNGGREALMEAQRFPDDYDGIIAGAPANFWTHLITRAIWDTQLATRDPAGYIPASKLAAITHGVNDACDASDGVTDGIINDPRQCHFDPAILLCKAADSDSCLTPPQVTTLKKLYADATTSNGRKIYPGFLPGAEAGGNGWATWITGSAPGKSLSFAFGTGFFADMVFEKADWDIMHADVDQAVAAADEKLARILNATDPNLAAFKSRGGKLILYHGWNDPAIPALSTIDYYDSVVASMGRRDADAFVRLFMVPGMQHCGGGPGPDSFGVSGSSVPPDGQHNIQIAIEQWVENGSAPSMLIAAKNTSNDPSGAAKMTRPLCAYPQIAKYKGTGDTNSAASFVCAAVH